MGIYRMGVPKAVVVAPQKRWRLDCFVESVTCHGDTVDWAATCFARVIAIDLSPTYQLAAVGAERIFLITFLQEALTVANESTGVCGWWKNLWR